MPATKVRMGKYTAERELSAITPAGKRRSICIRVGRPVVVRSSGGAQPFSCLAEITGISPATPIYGEDALQAVSLALSFVRAQLEQFLAKGGKLYFPEGSAFPVSAYFPKLVNKCYCDSLSFRVKDPDMPVEFDKQMDEFRLMRKSGGYTVMKYCFSCGGALPESKRSQLFQTIDESEQREALELMKDVDSVRDMLAKFGKPDRTKVPAAKEARLEKIYGIEPVRKHFVYYKRWKTFWVNAQEKRDGHVEFALVPKPKDESASAA